MRERHAIVSVETADEEQAAAFFERIEAEVVSRGGSLTRLDGVHEQAREPHPRLEIDLRRGV